MGKRIRRRWDEERTDLLGQPELSVERGKGSPDYFYGWNQDPDVEACPLCGGQVIKMQDLFSKTYRDIICENGKKRVIAFKKAFHGRTSLAVEITDNPKIIAPINANGHTTYLPLGDIEGVRAEIEKGDVTAVIIEGIQGVGGIQIPDDKFLQELQALCNATDTTLILDEIQSGCGRSGKFFAHQWAGIRPDIITQAKGIGNGFPVGVVLISPKFQAVYGELGTTFGGNHLACAAAEAVLEVIEEENLLDNVNKVGNYLMEELKKIPQIKEVRGRGLMIGIEFDEPIKEIRHRLLFEEHVFTGVSGTNVIRLLPPLTLSLDEAEEFIKRFKNVL